ncbi:hypothetical protein [Undibacterium sp. Ren11W]|uniref:hypothetical protein n=1 Tax=Undibacterium sp. Ren11W TaxID=3413045 RepID=UPI003BF44694
MALAQRAYSMRLSGYAGCKTAWNTRERAASKIILSNKVGVAFFSLSGSRMV